MRQSIFKYIHEESFQEGCTKAEVSTLGVSYYLIRFLAFILMEASGLLSSHISKKFY